MRFIPKRVFFEPRALEYPFGEKIYSNIKKMGEYYKFPILYLQLMLIVPTISAAHTASCICHPVPEAPCAYRAHIYDPCA